MAAQTLILSTIVATCTSMGLLEDSVTYAGFTVIGPENHETYGGVTVIGRVDHVINTSVMAIGPVDHMTTASLTATIAGDHMTNDSVTSTGQEKNVTGGGVTTGSAGEIRRVSPIDGGMLTASDYVRFATGIVSFCTPAAVIGIFTNSLAIAVFLRMPRTVTSTYFLLASFVDLGYLVLTVVVLTTAIVVGFHTVTCSYVYLVLFVYALFFGTTSLRRLANCVTMLISLDRCFMIAFPFKARHLEHVRRPKLYVCACGIVVFAVRVPWLFYYRPERLDTAPKGCLAEIPGRLVVTPFYVQSLQNGVESSLNYVFIILFTYVPVITMSFSTIFMVFTLLRHAKRSSRGKFKQQEPQSLKGSSTEQNSQGEPCTESDVQVTPSGIGAGGLGQTESAMPQFASAPFTPTPSTSSNAVNSLLHAASGTVNINPLVHAASGGSMHKRVNAHSIGYSNNVRASNNTQGSTSTGGSIQTGTQPSPFFKLQWQQSLTVVVYTAFYVVVVIPDALQAVLAVYLPGYHTGGKEHYLYACVSVVYVLLDVLSSTMNFFVYMTTGSVFRAHVKAIICRWRC